MKGSRRQQVSDRPSLGGWHLRLRGLNLLDERKVAVEDAGSVAAGGGELVPTHLLRPRAARMKLAARRPAREAGRLARQGGAHAAP